MTPPELYWQIILGISVLAGIGVAVKKIFFSGFPQPLDIREATNPRDIYHLERRVSAVETRVDHLVDDVKDDISNLHEKMNLQHAELMRAIGRLEGSQ